ncbi:diaminopimelate epimerase [Sphingobacterium bovistauri]|uniref:Diaminopimelate epimerase n=1 Tax=Sphingobacterium bovistauri TaxID=2781959 RepID=A0ABS7Z227_9SPHI|nr:diaminopimelate epimerase [Sphingobacterium bovistauri]MCA5004222.1 diaminopimelate epimerase [Sphingobacterium bovistauri]
MSIKIQFSKYQGAGNDFILIDNRNGHFDRNNEELIKKLCDRRFGIGGDGLMLLQNTKNFDFEMVYYNADGAEGTMCGNGGRCIVAFARDLNIISEKTDFLAVDGPHDAEIAAYQVNLGMIDVNQIHRDREAYVMNTGSPHYILKVNDLANLDVFKEGYAIRNNEIYGEKGINVNFIEPEENGYFVRTFERGVEDETFACGTGATAAAMAMAIDQSLEGDLRIPIRVLGGQLYISFHKSGNTFTNVYLKGPANFVFKGEIEIG